MRERSSQANGAADAADAARADPGADSSTTLHAEPNARAGCQRGLQLVVLEASGMSLYPLPATGTVSIGRGDDCDIRIADALASRRHATLHLSPLAIEDAGSANGTLIAARRAEHGSLVEIQCGQAIAIGRTLLIVRATELSRPPVAEPRRSGTPSPFTAGGAIVVRDPDMERLYALVERLAQGVINVLILGETGVGKEVVAEALHRASPRSKAPFLCINCATLAEALLESELFGHERGAFTGAVTAKPGLLESATGGTVFLDEVGELSASLQAKLLRVIETHEATRVGGLQARRVDVRFLFATNRNLEAEVASGAFRPDLFFRLRGATLEVPALRERASEIIPLAEAFLRRAAERMNLPTPPTLTEEATARLLAHRWPGNVRELRNVVERAVLLCSGDAITGQDLALESEAPTLAERAALRDPERSSEIPGALERDRISQALLACGGNQRRAAESLQMPLRTLVRKIARLGLPRPHRTG